MVPEAGRWSSACEIPMLVNDYTTLHTSGIMIIQPTKKHSYNGETMDFWNLLEYSWIVIGLLLDYFT